jgi:hypothetical protein
MWSTLDTISFLTLGVSVAAPLAYALTTLRGMRAKAVYPLIRVRTHDGGTVPLVVEQTWTDTGFHDDACRHCVRLPV